MQQHNFLQGSPEWHAHRARAKNASDAPAMLGCSPYTTRQQLLQVLATGLRPEVSQDQQRIFDSGHAIEAAQRPGAEQVVGEELFPVVGSQEVEGVLLSASFDGITMTEETVYECKTLNADLRTALNAIGGIDANDGRNLPKHYRVQMEQQLAVSGAQRVLFVAATRDGQDVRRCWYYPDPVLRAEIIAGWKQLDADLAAFVAPSPAAMEKIVAEPVEALPAVSVKVEGSIVIRENFDAFEAAMRDFLANRLIREPKTDQDFADLEVQIKAMKGAEAALDAAEAGWIAQIEPVSAAKRRKDMMRTLVRDNRLLAEKLLASEKERRRGDIVAAAVKALADHVAALNKRLGKPYMPTVPADFGGCIKGLKSLASMEDRVATELARAKIAANEIRDRISENLQQLGEWLEFAHLFPDTAAIVLKAPDDCRALIESRIAAHRAEQERRAAELAERERTRIRAEEEARARAEAQREQQEREAAKREEARRAEQQSTADLAEKERLTRAAEEPKQVAAPAANVVPMPTKAPAPGAVPTLRLGEIQKRLAPLSIDAAGLATLGFPFAKQEGASKLWHEHTFPAICDALITKVAQAREQQLQAA